MNMIQEAIRGFLIQGLNSTTDSNGAPLEDNYTLDQVADKTKLSLGDDVQEFYSLYPESIAKVKALYNLTDEVIGRNLWDSRAGCGGFIELGAGTMGNRLDYGARQYGEIILYVGDDDLIYHE